MGACSKINAISLNVKINERKSVHICGYILPINVQNFMQKDSAQAKISLKVVWGLLFFDSPCIQKKSPIGMSFLNCHTFQTKDNNSCAVL